MSQEIFYHGYSQYELEALKIPNAARGECLPLYVPYMKCILNANSFSRWAGRACDDEKVNYAHCIKIQQCICQQKRRERVDSSHLKKMKLNNPAKFEQLNVAPALETEYAPTFLNLTRH